MAGERLTTPQSELTEILTRMHSHSVPFESFDLTGSWVRIDRGTSGISQEQTESLTDDAELIRDWVIAHNESYCNDPKLAAYFAESATATARPFTLWTERRGLHINDEGKLTISKIEGKNDVRVYFGFGGAARIHITFNHQGRLVNRRVYTSRVIPILQFTQDEYKLTKSLTKEFMADHMGVINNSSLPYVN